MGCGIRRRDCPSYSHEPALGLAPECDFVQDIGLTPVGLTPAPGVHPDFLFARRLASGYPLHPSRGQLNASGITLFALA